MRVYTKTGDKGETGLMGGRRVSKSDPRIEAIGAVDELNASLAVLMAHTGSAAVKELLTAIQNSLFTIGAELADPEKKGRTQLVIVPEDVQKLERAIDELEDRLPPLKNFILYGGTPFAAHAHLARSVCRRAERRVVGLNKAESVNPQTITYLNRLSDLLFILARENLHENHIQEIIWKP